MEPKLLYKLEATSEQISKFLEKDGSGEFETSCLFMDMMTKEEVDVIVACGTTIADVIKEVAIRIWSDKVAKEE